MPETDDTVQTPSEIELAHPAEAPTLTPTQQAVRLATDALNAKKAREERFSTMPLENGAVLKLKTISRAIINRAMARFPEPQVPIVNIESKGRSEPNPNDPDYLAAMVKYHEDRMELYYHLLVLFGTEFESAPEGVFAPQDDGWLIPFQKAEIEIDISSELARYEEWFWLYASTEADKHNLMAYMIGRTGVTEVEVAQAIVFFRRETERRTNLANEAREVVPVGDHVRNDSGGADLGDGGEGSGEVRGVQLEPMAGVGPRAMAQRDSALPSQ